MSLETDGAIADTATVLTVTGTVPSDLAAGFMFALEDEVLMFGSFNRPQGPVAIYADATSRTTWNVVRGVGKTIPAAHDTATPLYAVVDGYAKSADLTPPSPFPAGSLSADIVAGLEAAASPSGKNPFATVADVPNANEKAALDAANNPTGKNPFATMADVGGGSSGVWKTYGTDSTGLPLSGVTVGNGALVGRWWTDRAVTSGLSETAFLCHVAIAFTLGSSSSVDGAIIAALPALVDGSGYNLLPAGGYPFVACGQAAAGDGGSFGGIGAVALGAGIGAVQSFDGTPWAAAVPFTWADGDQLLITATFLAQFVAD